MKYAVVVPVYKESLTHSEEFSLKRCFKVLKKYPILLAYPKGLDVSAYLKLALDFEISLNLESFDDVSFFADIVGYNKLMLDKSFYERFIDYDRILIYQTDCFVFEDKLAQWVKFDYVGAPWIIGEEPRNLKLEQFKLWIKDKIKYRLGRPNDFDTVQFRVGNGGFSLRNPKLFVQLIDKFEKKGIIQKYRNPLSQYYLEDVFWGVEVARHEKQFEVPNFYQALDFSFECLPRYCFKMNNKQLPFGCHAWGKYDFDFWKPYFE
ncbi:MAG: hypothetical protein RL662_2252 [Bacteroidota bacterium]|jgi:hypothetical protein